MTELFSCNLRDDVTIEAIEEALMNEEKGKGRALSFFNKEARNSELLQDYSGRNDTDFRVGEQQAGLSG